jgi:hypothetical protein
LFAYIGCFTSAQRNARAKGISVYRIDQAGAWTLVQTLETVPNPQFIAFDRQQKFLYSVHGDGTDVSSYAIDKPSGRITFLNKQPTSGNNSTHLTPDPSNRYIVIGNGPGVAVFPINPDGSLAPYTRARSGLTAIKPEPARTRITSRSIPAAVFWLRPTVALTGFTFSAWTFRPASSCRMDSQGPAPAPVPATSHSIRPGRGPTFATNSIPPSRLTPGIPNAANSTPFR